MGSKSIFVGRKSKFVGRKSNFVGSIFVGSELIKICGHFEVKFVGTQKYMPILLQAHYKFGNWIWDSIIYLGDILLSALNFIEFKFRI